MTPDKIKLSILTPDRLVLEEQVDEVVLPSVEGSMGVLPGHAPLLAALDIGEVSYRVGSRYRYLACSGGFAEVLPDRVSLLAETAERAEEIDVERARQAHERAEARLRAGPARAELATIKLKRAVSRISISSRRGG